MMKTLYVTDLDGTLLNSKDSINEYSLQVINGLIEKGMLFTYATARSLSSASVVAKGLTTQNPVIIYNGAFIINPSTGEVLSSVKFTEAESQMVVASMQKNKVSPLVYSFVEQKERVSWMTDKENDGMKNYLSHRKGDKRMRPLPSEQGLYDGDIFYFTCIGDREELCPVYEEFGQDENYTCTFQRELYREEYWLEIMPRKATKANAILTLKELWNCDKVISFGDAINDLPMFRISDECYAVENAVDKLKELATGIIEGNDADGVAKWLLNNVDI